MQPVRSSGHFLGRANDFWRSRNCLQQKRRGGPRIFPRRTRGLPLQHRLPAGRRQDIAIRLRIDEGDLLLRLIQRMNHLEVPRLLRLAAPCRARLLHSALGPKEDFENRSKNKLRTEHPGTGCKTVKQGACKSLRSKDGPLVCWAHNPKVAGSNPAPATTPFIMASGRR